eukprot:1984776-Prymnesium_polylepis.2
MPSVFRGISFFPQLNVPWRNPPRAHPCSVRARRPAARRVSSLSASRTILWCCTRCRLRPRCAAPRAAQIPARPAPSRSGTAVWRQSRGSARTSRCSTHAQRCASAPTRRLRRYPRRAMRAR